ncbi:MAG: Histidinol-phosphatase [alternative form] [Rhodanobacteraceae bacterium]|jgi:histidinol-phosphatase|nr:MAG: Histidinol-phosphatase [alternative form] [Rhodanobacteraceae bacterium]
MPATLDDAFLDHALEVALVAARAAGARIAQHFRQGVAVEIKPDATPVTVADREAEDLIRSALKNAFTDHAILGEERGHEGDGAFLWLVDPLDGTKSFVRGTPFFSTQIALMHGGELVLGVSHAPLYGETMWARRGGGAWLDGRRVRVSDVSRIGDAALSLGNVKSLAQDAHGWSALGGLVQAVNRTRGYGDFCHYHLLARGALDIVVESDVNILDIAALAVIVREAGGVFTDLSGAPPALETRSVLASVPALQARLLQRFAGGGEA